MQVTVITIYRGQTAESYVGVVPGTLTEEQKTKLHDDFSVRDGDTDEDPDNIFFRTLEMTPAEDLKEVLNIDGE